MASNSDNMEFCPNDYDKFSSLITNLNLIQMERIENDKIFVYTEENHKK